MLHRELSGIGMMIAPHTGNASLLAVTSELPWPLDRGGHLRSFYLLSALARRFRVRLVAGVPNRSVDVSAFAAAGISLVPAVVGSRTLGGEAWRAAKAAVRAQPYVLYRRHDRPAMRRAFRAALAAEAPSVVYLDHLDSLLFASAAPDSRKVIDLHNVYSRLTERTADESNGLRRVYLRRESRLLRRMEARAVREADAVLAVSEEDRQYFAHFGRAPVRLIPNGVDCAAYAEVAAAARSGPPLILFVGSLGWSPNAAAARYLVRELFPRVRQAVPDARVRIIGRDAPRDLHAMSGPDVDVLSDVADVRSHLAEAHVVAVPLEAGGGSRLKILEAFAAGVPVVSTPVGCEGLLVSADRHLLIARRDSLAEAVSALLRDPARARRLAREARQLVELEYDWRAVGARAAEAVGAVLESARSDPAASAASAVANR